jgi:hypothetical protein
MQNRNKKKIFQKGKKLKFEKNLHSFKRKLFLLHFLKNKESFSFLKQKRKKMKKLKNINKNT